MRFLLLSTALLLVLGFCCPVGTLQACPLCKDAISSPGNGEDEEINNTPAAYNNSIYLMAGMPFLLLGSVGYFIYRGCQRNSAYLGQTDPATVVASQKPA
jgi:hypothetical protein